MSMLKFHFDQKRELKKGERKERGTGRKIKKGSEKRKKREKPVVFQPTNHSLFTSFEMFNVFFLNC